MIATAPAESWFGQQLPRRSPAAYGQSRYVEPHERGLLARTAELPYSVLLFEAQRTIEAHTIKSKVEAIPDPHARWRDLVRPGTPTTYIRQTCSFCDDHGCPLLDAALLFASAVEPYERAERRGDTRGPAAGRLGAGTVFEPGTEPGHACPAGDRPCTTTE